MPKAAQSIAEAEIVSERRAVSGAEIARGDAIIAAAYDLLGQDGLEGLTVRAVLAEAKLNRRSFYERFSGKDDLVLAVFERSLQTVAEDCRVITAQTPDPLERLRFTIRYIVLPSSASSGDPTRNIRRNAALCREHMRLAEARPQDLRLALLPLIALLAEQLEAGVKTGQVRKADPERLAHLVYNLVSTTVHAEMLAQEADGPDRKKRVQLADDLWEFCRRAVVA